MDKKDIYEHLAKIYLDSSATKKKKLYPPHRFRNLLFISLVVILAASPILRHFFLQNKRPDTEIALSLLSEVAKINFNFDPAQKETYSVNLNKLNLAKFKMLSFSLKKTDYNSNISVRVEFTNAFNEKSEIYVKNIPLRWQDYKILLADFKTISDWSEMNKLSFIVEVWNAQAKDGVIYIDNIKLLR
jgi:hypothetical protein